MNILLILLQAIIAFFAGTVLADFAHYLFHAMATSRFPSLRAMGKLHLTHHQFYTSKLQINHALAKQNFWHHALPEYLFQITGIALCLFFFSFTAILLAFTLQTFIFILSCYNRGADFHHRPCAQLPCYRGGFLVDASYHALHHMHPRAFFSSYIKVWDFLFGKGHDLAGKRIVMTGANGALGRQMKRLLEKEGATVSSFRYGEDYTYSNYDAFIEAFKTADILFLCHGTKHEETQAANCDSYVALIELFKQVRERGLKPLEIWAVGSEIECHPCFGIKKLYPYAESKRQFAKHAWKYYWDRDILYRHLVHSAFTSPMGPGLMSARVAAFMSLFFIKRGFRYVPVTYTGFAIINYFRFYFST